MNTSSPMSSVFTQAPSVKEILSSFGRIEQDMLGRGSAFERRALRNYLLHMLLVVSGREEELFGYGTATVDPDYVFYDTGLHVEGREAIVAWHREQASRGAAVCVPVSQRVAMSSWGFAAELTAEQYLPEGKLQRTHAAVVWRCDESGRLKKLHFYPAVRHEDVALSSPLDSAALAAELSPLISRLQHLTH